MMIDGINQLPAPLFLPSQDIIESNHREIGDTCGVWTPNSWMGLSSSGWGKNHGKQTRYFYMYKQQIWYGINMYK